MDFPEFAKEVPELPSSDESDQDYVPSGADSNLSEEDSDGDVEEDSTVDGDGEAKSKKGKRSKTRTKTPQKKKKYQHRKSKANAEDKNDENNDEEEKYEPKKKELSEEEAKQKADSIWQDFLKNTRPSASKSSPRLTNGSAEPKKTEDNEPAGNKVKITKVFEFAGEEVRVEKEVPKDSAEARLSTSKNELPTSSPACSKSIPPAGRGGLKGLSSVLGQLGKKPKLGTLEKSKLDWDRFKKNEGIEEELQTHNKGKDGYLERQDFLQRADVRQFEIERDLRASRRSNR